jgi:hypothetical protein
MKTFDVDRFHRELRHATQQSILEMQRKLSGEHLYGVFLLADRLGASVALLAQSDEGLERSVCRNMRQWTTKRGNLKTLVATMQRWDSSEDWVCLDNQFVVTNRLLIDVYGSNPDEYFDSGQTRLVHLHCLATLADLDAAGAFGRGKARESVVLNLYFGDQSDDDLLRWAIQVNPFEVYERYSTELQNARAAYQELEFVGSE